MRIHLTALLPVALAAGLLLVVLGSSDTVREPWGTTCHLAWCQPEAATPAPDPIDTALQFHADVAKASAGHDCVKADEWPAGQIPATMTVGRDGHVSNVPWTYPPAPGLWVAELCAR